MRLNIDENLVRSESGRNLIRSLIEKNPNKRLDLEKVLVHEWIEEYADRDETYMKTFCPHA
jgi:serine/threonine protein kinase